METRRTTDRRDAQHTTDLTVSDRSDTRCVGPSEDGSLESLLGHSRARLLLALHDHSATTTALASMLHATPSAVSQLLQRLRSAGLLVAQRQGREVFYRLTLRGRNFISLFDSDLEHSDGEVTNR